MLLPDGREALLTFNLPVDVTVIAGLIEGISHAAQRLGYTDVHVAGDYQQRMVVIGTPPARPVVLTGSTSRNTVKDHETRSPGEE